MADSPRLSLAECYYTVARDMEQQGQYLLDTAKRLSTYADALCEQNIREHRSAQQQSDKP